MNRTIKQIPFDIYLAATKADEQGNPLDAQYVETIMVDVWDNGQHQFLTEEASLEIEACRVKALFKRGTKKDLDSLKNIVEYKLKRL